MAQNFQLSVLFCVYKHTASVYFGVFVFAGITAEWGEELPYAKSSKTHIRVCR